jgi:membrane protein
MGAIEVLKGTLPGRVALKFTEDNGPNHAKLIAWNTLQAVFPILLFTAAALGFVLSGFGFRASELYTAVLSALPSDAVRQETAKALDGAVRARGLLLLVALAGLLWSGSGLFGAMEQTFDVVYRAPQRSAPRRLLMSFAMMLLFTLLAGAIVLSSTLLAALGQLPYHREVLSWGPVPLAIQLGAGVAIGFVLFSAVFFVVPNRRQRLSGVWPGALVSAVLFEVVTLAFPLYLRFARTNTYGKTFGLLLVVMLFFYVVGLIVMVGLELNTVLHPVERDPSTERAQIGDEGAASRQSAPRNASALAILAVAIAARLTGRRRGSE